MSLFSSIKLQLICYSYVVRILCRSHFVFVATLMGTQVPLSHLQWPPPPLPPAIPDQTQSRLVEHDPAFWSSAAAAEEAIIATETARINFNPSMTMMQSSQQREDQLAG